MCIFRVVIFVLTSTLMASIALGADYYIDASKGNNDNPGTEQLPWMDMWPIRTHQTPLYPGDHVKFKRGEVWSERHIVLDYSGEASNPIVYEAYGTGPRPKIVNYGIDFNKQSHVIVRDFDISGNAKNGAYGVGIPAGSEYVVLQDCKIHKKGDHHWSKAVWIEGGESARCNNLITNNDIQDNYGSAIGSNALCTEGNENIISNNRIHNNLDQGIELNGRYHIIEGNEIYQNGDIAAVDPRGNSGIHLVSDGSVGKCDNNIIRNNRVYLTYERSQNGADGNGIQTDMWCDDNLIYNNLTYNNDGPGIIIYGGDRNVVFHNTLYNNGLHTGGHIANAQLVVMDAVNADNFDCDVPEGCAETRDNIIYYNLAYSIEDENYAVLIDLPATKQKNGFFSNLWFSETSNRPAVIVDRDDNWPYLGMPPLLLSEWNSNDWADDMGGNPLFKDIHSKDFRLKDGSPAIDAGGDLKRLSVVEDFLRNGRPQGDGFDIGAYEMQLTNPSKPPRIDTSGKSLLLFLPVMLQLGK